MSIHQPIQLPVQIFSSEDANAPQLSAAGSAGEVKTILKACLSTGYGTKAAATDWEMMFEDGNKAVFRSTSVYSKQFCLKIDNNEAKKGQVTCYESMSDVNTGLGQWNYVVAQLVERYGTAPPLWKLFVTPVSFVFISERVYSGGNVGKTMFVFGDFMSTMPNDPGNVVCFSSNANTYTGGIASISYCNPKVAGAYSGAGGGLQLRPQTMRHQRTADYNIAAAMLAYPLYWCEGNYDARIIFPIQVGDRYESINSSYQTIAGRSYYVCNANERHGYHFVYYIPTDYWLL